MSKSLLFVTLAAAAADPIAHASADRSSGADRSPVHASTATPPSFVTHLCPEECRKLFLEYPDLRGGSERRLLSQSSDPVSSGQEYFEKAIKLQSYAKSLAADAQRLKTDARYMMERVDDLNIYSERMVYSSTLRCRGDHLKAQAMEVLRVVPDKFSQILSVPVQCNNISSDRETLQSVCHTVSGSLEEIYLKAQNYNFEGEPMWEELKERIDKLLDTSSRSIYDPAAPGQIWRVIDTLKSTGESQISNGKKIIADNPGGYRDGESTPERQRGKAVYRAGMAKKSEARIAMKVKNQYKQSLKAILNLRNDVIDAEKKHRDGEVLCETSKTESESVPSDVFTNL